MDATEQEAIDKLKAKQAEILRTFWSLAGTLDTADAGALGVYGYNGKTNAGAIQMLYRSLAKQWKAAVDEHVRKYPD